MKILLMNYIFKTLSQMTNAGFCSVSEGWLATMPSTQTHISRYPNTYSWVSHETVAFRSLVWQQSMNAELVLGFLI